MVSFEADGAPMQLVPRPYRGAIVLAVLYVIGLTGLGLFAIVKGASARTGAGRGFGFVFGCLLLTAGLLLAVGLLVRRPAGEVTSDSIRLRRGFLRRREQVIPLASVVAVGMVFEILHRPNGWFSYVWLVDDKPVSLGLGVCGGRSSDAITNWEKLATTPQGAACLEILNRARCFQGDSGPIAHDRVTNRRGFGIARAYWPANRALALSDTVRGEMP